MTLSPDDKPIFTQATVPDSYPGVTEEPTFDSELVIEPPRQSGDPAELPTLAGALSTGVPPAGRGTSRGYEVRRRMIAQLHARGFTNNQIGRHLGYSPGGVSIALKDPWVQAEVAKERASLVDQDAPAILKSASLHAAKRIERAIVDPTSKNGDAMSQFVIEKNYGKATQGVIHSAGDLGTFMELIEGMKSRGDAIDVTPKPQVAGQPAEPSNSEPTSQWDDWLDKHLP